MRSRVTLNCWPTSSSVWSVFMPMPKRMRSTRSSRGVRLASTRVVASRRLAWIAASSGMIAFLSSMKSPRWLSSSSPIGVSRLIGSLAIFSTLRTFSSGMPSFSASSSGVGSRPISCSIWRRGAHQLVDRLDHVHRDADGARLVGDRAGDRLADPPGRVGARTCSRGGTRTCRPPSSGRCCLPGSGRGTAGRGWCISWRSRSRGAGSPRSSPSWRCGLRARPAAPCCTMRRNSATGRPVVGRRSSAISRADRLDLVARRLAAKAFQPLSGQRRRRARASAGRARGRDSARGSPRA